MMSNDTLPLSPALSSPKPGEGTPMDSILRNIDPAPDQETERFVEAIYADRRESERRTG
jgi:hypothetical protein